MSCHHTKDHTGNKGLCYPWCWVHGHSIYIYIYAFLNQNKYIYLYSDACVHCNIPVVVAFSKLYLRMDFIKHI